MTRPTIFSQALQTRLRTAQVVLVVIFLVFEAHGARAGALPAAQQPVGGWQAAQWEAATRVEEEAGTAERTTANPACQPLSQNLAARIATVRALHAANQSIASAPPPTVKEALQRMFGSAGTNATIAANDKKIASERVAAAELNDKLRALGCAVIDIDHAVARQGGAAGSTPIAPRPALPNDLMTDPSRR